MLKPTYNEGFVNPDPGTCLFMVKEAKFDLNDNSQTICKIQAEITDCIEVEGNIGKLSGDYFGLYPIEKNGKTLYFGITNFMGFLHKATGRTKEVDEKHFDNAKVQAILEKKLPGCEYAGDVVSESYTDKEGNARTAVRTKRYKSTAEFKELKKNYTGSGSNGQADPASDTAAKTAAAAGDDDW